MMSKVETNLADYSHAGTTFEAHVAHTGGTQKRPVVLVAHQWAGQCYHECERADLLAEAGYVGIAIDTYGKGVRGTVGADNSALMAPLMADRALLRDRLLAAVAFAKTHPLADPSRIAVIGFCFGGLCALDVARSGTKDVAGVVSFHGVYPPPNLGPQGPIHAQVQLHHGWEDPLAPPQDVIALAKELTDAGAKWQLNAYGDTVHAFTAKGMNARAEGAQYNEIADRRSWQATLLFLQEIFA
tara:strand:+ start:46330 stop:47055 length:726 start_codon:yes stop_codon:yes gene_type:complete